MTKQEWTQFNRERWEELPEEIRTTATDGLNRRLSSKSKEWLETQMKAFGTMWWVQEGWHFTGGMYVRNTLRDIGILDDQIPSNNWDDYYIPVLEAAVLGAPICLSGESDTPEPAATSYDDWDQW